MNDTYWPHGQNCQLAVEFDKAKGTYFIQEVDGSNKHLPKDFVPDPIHLTEESLAP